MVKTLDQLREEITNLLVAAGWADSGSDARKSAFRQAGELEEEIASRTAPRDSEGEISRWGAVVGAVASGDMARARMLAARYMAEPIHPTLYHGISYAIGDALFPPPGLQTHLLQKITEPAASSSP